MATPTPAKPVCFCCHKPLPEDHCTEVQLAGELRRMHWGCARTAAADDARYWRGMYCKLLQEIQSIGRRPMP